MFRFALSIAIASRSVFVSPLGSDSNPGTRASPLGTLSKAAAVAVHGDSVVVLAGEYVLASALQLGKMHSGVSWAAEGRVTVGSGVRVPTWTVAAAAGVVEAPVPTGALAPPRHLFVNGARARRAVLPDAVHASLFVGAKITPYGFALGGGRGQPCAADHGSTTPCCGQGCGGMPRCTVTPQYVCSEQHPVCTGYVYDKHFGTCGGGNSSSSSPLQIGSEFAWPQSTSPWTEPRCAVLSANASDVLLQQPCWNNLVHKACGQGARGPPNYVEAVGPSYLAAPGDWAVAGGKLSYMLRPGESAATLDARVPALEVLLNVSDAENVTFSGFTFAHATWLRPGQGDGFVEQQTGQCAVGDFQQNHGCDSSSDAFWSVKSPGNVQVVRSKGIAFERCEFTQLGGTALDFTNTTGCVVNASFFHDISGAAIQIGSFQRPDAAHTTRGNTVVDTIVNAAGVEFRGAAAINVGYTQSTLITMNDVSNLTYVPMSCGWGWSRHSCWNCTNAANNTISLNRFHDYKQELNDGGGIYMLGPQNGSVVAENWVFDQGTTSSGALYPDEGSAYSLWQRNVVTKAYKWLHLWTASIHDVRVVGNYADTARQENHGTRCPEVNNTVFKPGQPPPDAVAIMLRAGVSPNNPWHDTLRPVSPACGGSCS